MSAMSTTPLATDQAHLMHPLHHPSAYPATRVWVKGQGARITDATGREYLDGLAGLWNVNIGHGRRELGEAALHGRLDIAAGALRQVGCGHRRRSLHLSRLQVNFATYCFILSGHLNDPLANAPVT